MGMSDIPWDRYEEVSTLRAKVAALEAENGRLRDAHEAIIATDGSGYATSVSDLRAISRAARAQQPSPAQDKEQG
jgi:hypothetical protein